MGWGLKGESGREKRGGGERGAGGRGRRGKVKVEGKGVWEWRGGRRGIRPRYCMPDARDILLPVVLFCFVLRRRFLFGPFCPDVLWSGHFYSTAC